MIGFVEQGGERYSGSVLNISAGGFYLHLSRLPVTPLKIHGVDDYGEIHYAGRNASGFGNLVRLEKFSNALGIGFSWDRDGMDEKSSVVLGEALKEQQTRRSLGQVRTLDSDVVLGGHVSSALSEDVFSSLHRIGAGKVRISLAESTSIDSSGIEMLMVLRDRGIPLINIGSCIEDVIQRFQLSRPTPDKADDNAG